MIVARKTEARRGTLGGWRWVRKSDGREEDLATYSVFRFRTYADDSTYVQHLSGGLPKAAKGLAVIEVLRRSFEVTLSLASLRTSDGFPLCYNLIAKVRIARPETFLETLGLGWVAQRGAIDSADVAYHLASRCSAGVRNAVARVTCESLHEYGIGLVPGAEKAVHDACYPQFLLESIGLGSIECPSGEAAFLPHGQRHRATQREIDTSNLAATSGAETLQREAAAANPHAAADQERLKAHAQLEVARGPEELRRLAFEIEKARLSAEAAVKLQAGEGTVMSDRDALGRVREGLDHLQRAVGPFVSAHMGKKYGESWLSYASGTSGGSSDSLDLYANLKTMNDKWHEVFIQLFDRNDVHHARNFLSTCRTARNNMSHLVIPLTDAEALRYLDAMLAFARLLKAGESELAALATLYDKQRREGLPPTAPAMATEDETKHSEYVPASPEAAAAQDRLKSQTELDEPRRQEEQKQLAFEIKKAKVSAEAAAKLEAANANLRIAEFRRILEAAIAAGIAGAAGLAAHLSDLSPENLATILVEGGTSLAPRDLISALAKRQAQLRPGALSLRRDGLRARSLALRPRIGNTEGRAHDEVTIDELPIGQPLDFTIATGKGSAFVKIDEGLAYLAVIASTSGGDAQLLVPNAFVATEDSSVEEDEVVRFPGRRLLPRDDLELFQMGPCGWEQLIVIASVEPLATDNERTTGLRGPGFAYLSDDTLRRYAQTLASWPTTSWAAAVLGYQVTD